MAVSVAQPLEYAEQTTRVEYLKRVALLTVLGLGVSIAAGTVSAGAVALVPLLQGRIVSIVVILGSYAIAQFLAPRLVFSNSASTRWVGFGLGSVFQGIAMGYLLLAAVVIGAHLGNPLLLVTEALVLTGVTALGMVVYVWSNPKEFSWLRAGLSMLFVPMLLLMGVSFVFPIGGPIGIVIAGVFVLISAAGLLYQVNAVLHKLRSDMYVQGAYLITMGVLILFWNLLVLLMRLQDR